MTTSGDVNKFNPCECPEKGTTGHTNEPGQPKISYRMGTYATIFQSMLDKIHTNALLQKRLTTRDSDDPAIAMLDAWAIVGDVLTFYQERIANEGYLGTATERRSILEMARTIGYELNPGVAASTYLAFTVDETDERYARVTIPVGTQLQSIPPQGKLPQTFETSEEFVAHAKWNALKPRQKRNQTLGIDQDDGELYFLDLTEDTAQPLLSNFYVVNPDPSIDAGDHVIATKVNKIFLDGVANKLQEGDIILLVGENNDGLETFIRPIKSIEIDTKLDRTVVTLAETEWEPVLFPMPAIVIGAPVHNEVNIQQNVLSLNISEPMMNALISVNQWNAVELLNHVNMVQTNAPSLKARQGVFAFREHVGFFGNNAPAWDTVAWETVTDKYPTDWDPNGWKIWQKYPEGTPYSSGADVYLERKVEGIAQGSWVIFDCPHKATVSERYTPYLVKNTQDESITGFSLSGKATGLTLSKKDGTTPIEKTGDFMVRNTTAHVKSECLNFTQLPIKEELEEGPGDDAAPAGVNKVMLDKMVLGLQINQPVIVSGKQMDAEGVTSHEVAILKNIVHSRGGYTILFFKQALKYRYLRDTVTIYGNVVPATHGETVTEVLGSGDGTQTNQRFKLKKPPLTFISASTSSGSESTLTVKVDGVSWKEASSLYGLKPRDQEYIVRIDNSANAWITFGDGKQGARLPTGQENIVATYRSGIGYDGEVSAESLKLLKTKPQGIRSVTNPIAAGGAAGPETLDKARGNAPLTVLTMERIVSLKDYEDFARTFTGIGKAQAVILWDGENELVHITIASSSGNTLDATSTTYQNLVDAIETCRNPIAKVRVDTFQKRLFHVKAKVKVDPKYTTSNVLSKAGSALESAFSFEKRDFGQPVTAAEIISIIQQVPGITYVDLDELYLTDNDEAEGQTGPPSVLVAHKARWSQEKGFQKAELLLINPVGITLTEITS